MDKSKMEYKTLRELKEEIELQEWELKERAVLEDCFIFDLITVADARLIIIDEEDERLDYEISLCRKFPKMREIKEIIEKVESLQGNYTVLYDSEARSWDSWSDRLNGEDSYPIGDAITIEIYKS